MARDDAARARSKNKLRPYAPSWIDRFNAWVGRLPGSNWAYYLGIGLLLFLIQTGVLWVEGVRPVGTFLGIHGFLAGMIVLFPALIHYLDKTADARLTALRPTLQVDKGTYEALRYRLATLPSFLALIASAIAAGFAVLLSESLGRPATFTQLAGSRASYVLVYATYILSWWMWGAFVLHTIHQLHVIHLIYTGHTRINLFRVRALYAFSGVTAISAVSLTLPPYAFLALNQSLRDPTAITITLPFPALALVAFVWPQLGVRRLLAEEKGRMLDALNLRREAAIVELRQQVDDRASEGIDDLAKVFTALEIEENALNKVSTWPWQPETVRYLVSALLLPLALWLIQFALQAMLDS